MAELRTGDRASAFTTGFCLWWDSSFALPSCSYLTGYSRLWPSLSLPLSTNTLVGATSFRPKGLFIMCKHQLFYLHPVFKKTCPSLCVGVYARVGVLACSLFSPLILPFPGSGQEGRCSFGYRAIFCPSLRPRVGPLLPPSSPTYKRRPVKDGLLWITRKRRTRRKRYLISLS